jgi:ABC-type branched-subunit amino acid transport system substrate-binding protein
VIDTAKIEGTATANYVASQHPTTIGLWDDSDTNGKQVVSSIQAQLESHTIQAFGLAPQSALEHDVYQSICDPDAVHNAQTDAFVAAYKAKFGASITQTATSVPYTFDAVNLLAAAVQKAGGDLSAAALIGALNSISYTGICGRYKSDAEHDMAHTAYIVSLAGGGKSLVTTYDNMSAF